MKARGQLWACAMLALTVPILAAACSRSALGLGPEVEQKEPDPEICAEDGVACGVGTPCCDSECVKGVCGAPRCVSGEAPVALAENLAWPLSLLVGQDYLYFVSYDEAGAVYRAAKDGSGAERIAEMAWPHDIAVDDTFIYVSSDSAIVRMGKDGSDPTTLASTFGGAGLALRGDDVVWAEYFGKNIKRVPRAGGATQTLASLPSSPFRLAVFDQRVLFTGIGFMLNELTDAGDVTLVLDRDVRNLAMDGGFAYVTINEQGNHELGRVSLSDGVFQLLAQFDGFAEGVSVDEGFAYVSVADGVVRVNKQNGQDAQWLSEEASLSGTNGVDDSCIYYTVRPSLGDDGDGRVMRVAK